jgi:hypothetical protein
MERRILIEIHEPDFMELVNQEEKERTQEPIEDSQILETLFMQSIL